MRALRLTIKEPGTLLSRLVEADITAEQLIQITRIVEEPDQWFLVSKDQLLGVQRSRIGFTPPTEGGANDASR